MANQDFKYFGLYALLLATAYIIYLVSHYRGSKAMTISSHAASSIRSMIEIAVVGTIHTILFGTFLLGWFAPTFDMLTLFNYVVIVMIIAELVVCWIADTIGWGKRIHHWSAFVAGGCGITIALLLAVSSTIALEVRLATTAYLLAALMGSCFFFFTNRIHKHILLYQLALYWIFFILLLVAAY